jgi:hypothetical protein
MEKLLILGFFVVVVLISHEVAAIRDFAKASSISKKCKFLSCFQFLSFLKMVARGYGHIKYTIQKLAKVKFSNDISRHIIKSFSNGHQRDIFFMVLN